MKDTIGALSLRHVPIAVMAWLLIAARIAVLRVERRCRDERGDVPGWVLITVMTAGLVIVIWKAAEPAIQGLVKNALRDVTGG